VKCAVADGETIFLSSANLTAQAFSINMELGVLVTSGNLANNVQERFGRLIKEGTIVAV
jgi:phosphatidylserine/phosphatidylglycerophosphate/cardiolipin synthase-like enzyme